MSVSTDGTAAQASLWMVDRAYLVAGRRARCLPRSAGSSVKLSVTASALVHKFQRAPDRPTWSAAAARLPSRDHMRTIRATGRSANRDGPLVQPAAADLHQNGSDAAGCTHRHVLADERDRWRTIGHDVRVEGWPAGLRSAGTVVVLVIDVTVSRGCFLSA